MWGYVWYSFHAGLRGPMHWSMGVQGLVATKKEPVQEVPIGHLIAQEVPIGCLIDRQQKTKKNFLRGADRSFDRSAAKNKKEPVQEVPIG